MNRDRLVEINKLLIKFREELKMNPDKLYDISSLNNTYYHIVRCNTPEKVNNADLFDYWIDNNKRDKTEVFVSPNWKYFCQFISQPEKVVDYYKHHKIYLSLDSEHMKEGVERLFDFLNRENIPHKSKVGKLSRDDQIVVRVISHEDCRKVVNFINNDPYIQEGKKKASPFAYQYKGVAIAADGAVSYNDSISKMLSLYLKEMAKNNSIDKINVNTFINFCVNYYNKYFVRKEDVGKVLNDFGIKNSTNVHDIVDFKYCVKLFLNGLNNSFDFDKYANFIEVKRQNIDNELQGFKKEINNDDYLKLFDELCEVMINKYGLSNGSDLIRTFFITFDSTYITRDYNLRKRVYDKNFVDYIHHYAVMNEMSLGELIESRYNKNVTSMFEDDNSRLLRKGLLITYDYHNELYRQKKDKSTGYSYARSAIVRLLRDGEYIGFTRQQGVRDKIKSKISKEEALEIVCNELGLSKDNNEDFYDMVDLYLNRVLGLVNKNTVWKKV